MAAAATRPRATLADLLPGERVRDVVLVVLGAVLTGVAAQVVIPIPGTPVPITGQTFAVLLTGASLGFGRGALSMLLYAAAGVAGVPWFAKYASGTFGYIIGFVVAAAMVGWLAQRGGDRTLPRTLATMLAGTAVIYLVGATWLAIDLHVSAQTAFTKGVRPFLIGDALKLLLATGLLPAAWWLVGRRGRDDSSI